MGWATDERAVVGLSATDWRALPACAELLGGLPTPRPAAEIVGGDGHDVLDGGAKVVTVNGEDVTGAFVAGARVVAELATEHGVTRAILQARSPSCGCGGVYDGTHTGELVEGDGIVAAMLEAAGRRHHRNPWSGRERVVSELRRRAFASRSHSGSPVGLHVGAWACGDM
ncbi:DUF523 domain-containing protein [Prescottella defluvii]|nr:DUF523 domain-containing protein [Prescottella defluvii]